MAIKNLAKLTNEQLWNMCRAKDRNFANVTSEATAELFTEKGFTALTNEDVNVLGDFYKLSIRIAFQSLEVAKVRNPFENVDLVEVYNTTEGGGGMVQRIYLKGIDALDPQFKEWNKYETKSPFMDLGAVPSEQAFWTQNFDYQAGLTLAEFDIKRYFLNEYGMGQFIAGYMAALDNCYKMQRATLTKEMINGAINNEKYPLQETQVYSVEGFDLGNATTAQVVSTIKMMKNVKTAVNSVIQSGAYNAAGYESTWDIDSDSVCLVRAGVKADLESVNKLNAPGFGTDIPFDNVLELTDFGGIQFWTPEEGTEATETISGGATQADLVSNPLTITLPDGSTAVLSGEVRGAGASAKYIIKVVFSDISYRGLSLDTTLEGSPAVTIPLTRVDPYTFECEASAFRVPVALNYVHGIQVYQAYDQMGAVIKGKYSLEPKGEVEPSILDANVTRVDPNEDVLAIVMQKGALFEDRSNSYAVRTNGLNSRTLRQTFWASLPNSILAYDHHRGVIVFTK